MEVTSNKPFLIKKCTEIINGISAVNGAVPVIGAVPYNDYTIENANNEKCIGITVLLAIPVIGDLVRLKEKLYISISSGQEVLREINALKKAYYMNLLPGMFYGNAKTGAERLSKGLQEADNEYLEHRLFDIKNNIKKERVKEYIAKNKGEVYEEKKRKLKICTDGKVSKLMEITGNYGDEHHGKGNTTRFLYGDISADEIPYIVVPEGGEYDKFAHSVGVVITEDGNYLYCVVAETGPIENGLGEVSIYAAWKLHKLSTPPELNKFGNLDDNYMLGEDSKDEKKYRFILFEKSAPAPKKNRSGWKYKNAKAFRQQIVKEGRKCYRGTGKCLNL